MAINKIKIHQLDADLSGVIYNASTGFFVQTGAFVDFSGQVLTKTGFYAEKVVFSTGNQTISGVKNFASRPLFNNQPLSLQSDGVQTTGIQDIFGQKNFRSGCYFYDDNVFSNAAVYLNQSSLIFTGNSNFAFEGQSASNFANSLSNNFLLLNGQQTISGAKIFNDPVGGISLQSGSFTLSGSQIINKAYLENGQSTLYASGLTGKRFVILNQNNTNNRNFEIDSLATHNYFRLYGFSGTSVSMVARDPFEVRCNLTNAAAAETSLIFPTGHAYFRHVAGTDLNSPLIGSGNREYRNYFSFGYNNVRIFNMALSGCSGNNAGYPFISTGDNTSAAFFPSWNFLGSGALGSGIGDTVGKNIALGLPLYRWSDIYSYNAPNIVSDRNSKSFISSVPDQWLDIWENINYCRYKFNSAIQEKGAANARWHLGVIAQDICEEFQKSGINAFELGLISKSFWGNQYDESGNLIKASGELLSIRADECQFMELALMRREINRLKSGIN
jgi:hypothetical protein